MRNMTFIFIFVLASIALHAQKVGTYIITADSVKLTSCDSSELIIENHTQNVPGFLFNTGRGRTIFKRGLQQLTNHSYLIGSDTLNAWIQGGNSFGATGVLGTLDNHHLDLYADDTQRVRLTSTGNLLINTTTDDGHKLQVNGTSTFSGTLHMQVPSSPGGTEYFMNANNGDIIGAVGHQMFFQVPATTNAFNFEFGADSGFTYSSPTLEFMGPVAAPTGNIIVTSPRNFFDLYDVQNIWINASPIYISGGGYSGEQNVVIRRDARSTLMTDPLLSVMESDTNVFQVLKNGNIGINTATPQYPLDVNGTTRLQGAVRLSGLTEDSTKANVLVSDVNGNLYYRSASSLAADDLIRSSLAVNSPITARKLTLSGETNWPDYVFDSTYRLRPLSAVAAYLQKEHHLPDIPAAAEIQKQGLDVGANQAALLKKIEELTLYNIDQAKKLEEQNKRMQTLDQQLIELKAEVEELKAAINQRNR